MTLVKICGLKTPEDVANAVDAGANYLGFNFYPRSPRSISIETAIDLCNEVPAGICKVGLTVDMDDISLTELMRVPLDMLQLHGSETPERVTEVKEKYGLPVMKVIGIADAADVAKLDAYYDIADQIMVDAKPPRSGGLPGGNGLAFDWRLIAGRDWPLPWMLVGGLTPDNVAEAIALTGAKQVDVASGVESAPGVKNPDLVRAFVAAAQ